MRPRRKTATEDNLRNEHTVSMWTVLHRELFSTIGALSGGNMTDFSESEAGDIIYRTYYCSPYCYSIGFWFMFLVTIVICTCHDWNCYRYFSKTRVFFFLSWLKALISVAILQVLLRKFSLSFRTRFSNARKKFLSLWPLMLLHSLTVYIQAVDFLKPTRNASGTEFYQISLVLSMSALMACLHAFSVMSTPGYLYLTVLSCTGIQLMLLCGDDDFDINFTTSLYSFIFVAIKASYIVVLTGDLQQEAILQLTYYLNLGLCFSHAISLVFRGEIEGLLANLFSIQDLLDMILQAFFMALSGVVQMAASLFMLKVTDPLMFIFTLNLTWVPSTLIHAFLYKTDFMVCNLRVFWIFAVVFVMLLVREPWTGSETSRGDTTKQDGTIYINTR